jgi:putative oxidoreductase
VACRSRLARAARAFLLAGFSLLSACCSWQLREPMQMILFMKNVALAGGFLMIVSLGAGAFSVDGRKRG